MRTYRELFGVAEFRSLFAAQCALMIGSAVSGLALGTTTYAVTGSPLLTALSLFGGPLVRLAGSWFLGAWSDLLRPRTALMLVGAVSAVSDALQTLPDLAWGWRFVLLALPWVVMSATGGSMMALVSDILPAGAYVFGRATMNIAVGGMQIVGYAVGGLLLAVLEPWALFAGAAVAAAATVPLIRLGVRDHGPRATAVSAVRRSVHGNRMLLGSPVVRPVLLSLWVPNGLIVGCEALFVPVAGREAGYLYAATAGGMLVGDVVVGRFVPAGLRERLVQPLRVLLAAPYLALLLHPAVPVVAVLGLVASVGYAASLPLQERLVAHTDPAMRGQVLGLFSTGLTGMQGIGAVIAGLVAGALGLGAPAAATAIGVLAAASLLVTAALTPGLARSRPEPVALA